MAWLLSQLTLRATAAICGVMSRSKVNATSGWVVCAASTMRGTDAGLAAVATFGAGSAVDSRSALSLAIEGWAMVRAAGRASAARLARISAGMIRKAPRRMVG
jgi:hypothetical protein